MGVGRAELESLISQTPVAPAAQGKGRGWDIYSWRKGHLFHLGTLPEAFLEEVAFQPNLEGWEEGLV